VVVEYFGEYEGMETGKENFSRGFGCGDGEEE